LGLTDPLHGISQVLSGLLDDCCPKFLTSPGSKTDHKQGYKQKAFLFTATSLK